jgi:hypothetical protein
MSTTENEGRRDLALTIITGVLAIAVTAFAVIVAVDVFLESGQLIAQKRRSQWPATGR